MISDAEVPVLEESINRLAAAVDGACAKMDELRAEKRELLGWLNWAVIWGKFENQSMLDSAKAVIAKAQGRKP